MAERNSSSILDLRPYRYDKLEKNKIRLIILERAINDDIVRCHMTTASIPTRDDTTARPFSSLTAYAALSYTWGQHRPDGSHLTHSLICDGQLMRITSTLERALRRLVSRSHKAFGRPTLPSGLAL